MAAQHSRANRWGFLLALGIGFLLLLGFSKKFWWDTPAFLFALETSLAQDPAVVQGLGQVTGYSIHFDRESTRRIRPFRITVRGECPQGQVTVTGMYYLQQGSSYHYERQDTTATWCRPEAADRVY